MKHTLGVLSLCFLATWTSAAHHPLCSLQTMFANVTPHMQILSSIIHGDMRALECLAGCGLYTVNQTMGHIIHPLAGPVYFMFENCIEKGVRTADMCTITDCVLGLIRNSLKLAKSTGMHIPHLDSVEQFIGCMKPKHTVEHAAEEIFTGHQITASPYHTKTSPTQEERPSDTSAATTTVLHICGYLLLSVSISHT